MRTGRPAINWKSLVVRLTESPEARAGKIDASFFPPVAEAALAGWEAANSVRLPADLRSFLLQSDGLEAQCGEIRPVLPLHRWERIHDDGSTPHPRIRFGETATHRYLLAPGPTASIRRRENFGSGEGFFAADFRAYLEQVFRGRA